MATKKASEQDEVIYHKNGSLWARGKKKDGLFTGYWEWFRKDGTRLRSGHFEGGEQVGEWVTYDNNGEKCKVTHIKPKARKDA
jgi:antitoxin component YwqK of YwqJK toxin-antitoxin module